MGCNVNEGCKVIFYLNSSLSAYKKTTKQIFHASLRVGKARNRTPTTYLLILSTTLGVDSQQGQRHQYSGRSADKTGKMRDLMAP